MIQILWNIDASFFSNRNGQSYYGLMTFYMNIMGKKEVFADLLFSR